jgi:hypothetical protein
VNQPPNDAPVPDENPHEPPQTSVGRRGEKRRVMLFALGVFLVPVAAVIAGYLACWGAAIPAATMAPSHNYLVPFLAGVIGFLVGAIAAGWGVVLLLKKWMDR